MTPSRNQYPEFVPDQLLTSGNLNDMFGYLEEQDRLTRANLLGIGVVCGLEVWTATDGTSIEITKGTGVTSEGHLVAFDGNKETRTFGYRVAFDPEKVEYYSKFLDAGNKKKFDLWELKREASGEGVTALTKAFLEGNGVDTRRMVVLAFVELLEEQNKNCNTESCDDKGATIHVNLRFLLAERGVLEANNLKPGAGPHHFNHDHATLPEMRMRRFDVAATPIDSAAGLLTAYGKILSSAFLADVEHVLSDMWRTLKPILEGTYKTTNPFEKLAESFKYLHDGSIDSARLGSIQYVYDHFSDLIAAYEELRQAGMEFLGRCCPNRNLFPRHLMLDLAIPTDTSSPSEFRHRFRRSPAFEDRDLLLRLRSLFRRLALMANDFHVPELPKAATNPDGTIRFTPSRLDPSPLSEKAIPYYYRPHLPENRPLYEEWSFRKSRAVAGDTNLSWHAAEHWGKSEFVKDPLLYDLEQFNFLRIEGHLGKKFSQAIGDLKAKVKSYRLPIDVVGVVLGGDASTTEIADPRALREIQIQYEVLRSEVVCCLKKQVEYWGRLKVKEELGYGRIATMAKQEARAPMVAKMLERDRDPVIVDPDEPDAPGPKSPPAPANRAAETESVIVAPTKLEMVGRIIKEAQGSYLILDYQDYQATGNVDMAQVPDSRGALDAAAVSLHAMKIIDAVASLLVLLEAESPLSLDVDALSHRGEVLEKTIAKFLDLVDAELGAQRPLQKLNAYLGDSHPDEIRKIAKVLPDPTEAEVDQLILILNNLVVDDTVAALVRELKAATSRAAKTAVVRKYADMVDADGAMIPVKEVAKTGDPFLIALGEKLRNFGCVCSLGGFAKLRQLLSEHLDDLRKANLFSVFAADHPGLQHKGGVPLGGTFVVAYLRKGGVTKDVPSERYKTAAADFPDGMVVADFYLPYRIASNLPPVVFQVMESEPAPEVVTLSLRPNPQVNAWRYSVGDSTAYGFAHSPNLGDLVNGTSVNGVTTQGADNYVFTPSKARALLGNDIKAAIEFAYVKRGVSSAPVKVEIYNVPTAEISLVATSKSTFAPGDAIAVQASSKYADTYQWTLQDASGKPQSVGSVLALGSLHIDKPGRYILVLAATQSATGEKTYSNEIQITVEEDQEMPVKTCGDLGAILASWKALAKKDVPALKTIVKEILDPLGVSTYFADLEKVAKSGVAEQIRFFAKPVGGKSFAAMMAAWTKKLQELLVNPKAGAERELLLELYGIFLALILYVACLRRTDLAKEDQSLFSDLVAQIKGNGKVLGIAKIKNLTTKEKALLEKMSKVVDEEEARHKVNTKLNPKPLYASALTALAGAL